MDKKTLRELESIVEDMEITARKNAHKFLMAEDTEKYMYWRGKRSALSDISIKISELLSNK